MSFAQLVTVALTTAGFIEEVVATAGVVRRSSDRSALRVSPSPGGPHSAAEAMQSEAAQNSLSTAECQHDRGNAISNYRSGNAAIWFFHITHNAGTSWRAVAMKNGQEVSLNGSQANEWFNKSYPTNSYVLPYEEAMLPHPQRASLSSFMPCTSDKWVSAIAMRDPIGRIVSGDGMWTTTGTAHVDSCNTDNYGLRMFIGKNFKDPLTKDDVALAKQRLDSFDFVLDASQMNLGIMQMCHELGWASCNLRKAYTSHDTSVRRLAGEEVWRKWMHRNRYELEVYEYAKNISRRLIATLPKDSLQEFMASSLQESVGASVESLNSESHLKWKCKKDDCGSCNEK